MLVYTLTNFSIGQANYAGDYLIIRNKGYGQGDGDGEFLGKFNSFGKGDGYGSHFYEDCGFGWGSGSGNKQSSIV